MLVTKTEMFTDWSYEGAHMGEQAATVGRGLMSGHIYFRFAYDFLDDGETVQRERSFVELSDGSTYELGSGASAEKITIIDDGITSSGEVHLQVIGKPEIGVGVSRILRHVTIEYDDGKVPVLDTDQLNGILSDLSDHLTGSMVDTAEAVKQELRNELNTKVADVQVNMQNVLHERLTETKTEIREETAESIKQMSDTLDGWVESATSSMDAINDRLNNLRIPAPVFMQCSTPGQYTLQSGDTVNLFHALPNGMASDSPFTYRPNYKTISISGGAVPYDRMLRVTFITTLNISDGAVGPLHVSLRNHTDEVSAQQVMYLDRDKMNNRVVRVQFSFETFIAANDSTHPALNNGFRLNGYNRSGAQVIFEGSSAIMLTLTSA